MSTVRRAEQVWACIGHHAKKDRGTDLATNGTGNQPRGWREPCGRGLRETLTDRGLRKVGDAEVLTNFQQKTAGG